MFAGIKKLAPGTWLRIRENGEIYEQRYWDLWDHTTPLTGVSEDEIAQRVLAELRTAVKLRKVSDVPVGVFLSGGIDSSTNAALFSEGESRPVQTFTIGYEGKYDSYQNELHFAKMMAGRVNSTHHERLLTQDDLIGFLPEMIHLQDEPIGDPVCVPVYFVSKLARDNGVIVCQVGEGADELFWGYESWKIRLNLQRWNDAAPIPNGFRRAGLAALSLAGQGGGLPYEALRRASVNQPVFWGGVDCFTENQKQRLLSPRLREKFKTFSSWEVIKPLHDRFKEKAWEKSPLNWMSFLDLSLRLPELLLMRVDKMSMGVSLEGRVPFLDHKFVELAMSIPESVKTRNGTLKYILKKAVRGVIPDELIDRPKQGFGVPVYEWVRDRLGVLARKELEEFCAQCDILNIAEVRRYLDRGAGAQIWYLLNLALWHKHWIRGSKND